MQITVWALMPSSTGDLLLQQNGPNEITLQHGKAQSLPVPRPTRLLYSYGVTASPRQTSSADKEGSVREAVPKCHMAS